MLNKIFCSFSLVILISAAAFAQSRTMYIGDVELRLGMPRDAAMKALSKYSVAAMGSTSFSVSQYNERTKLHDMLGSVGFDGNVVSYISHDLDTSAWPNDEGFSVAVRSTTQ